MTDSQQDEATVATTEPTAEELAAQRQWYVMTIADYLEDKASLDYATLLGRAIERDKATKDQETNLLSHIKGLVAYGQASCGLTEEEAKSIIFSTEWGEVVRQAGEDALLSMLAVYALATLTNEHTPFTPKDREEFHKAMERGY